MATSPYGNLMNLRGMQPAGGIMGGASAGHPLPFHAVGPQGYGGMQGGYGGFPGSSPMQTEWGNAQLPGTGMSGAYGGGGLPFHAVGPQQGGGMVGMNPYQFGGGQANPVQGSMGGFGQGGVYGHPVGPQPTPSGPVGIGINGSGLGGARPVGPQPGGMPDYNNLMMLRRMGY